MKIADFNRLKKLMMTTMSGADAEVLFAMKKANDLLRAEGVDWDRVLNRMVTLDVESVYQQEAPDRTEDEQIEDALRAVEADDPRGSFADFIASIRSQFDRHHRLSDKQKEALFRAASQARSRL